MNYAKKLILLANSRKPGGRCVAGKEVLDEGVGAWIRPVSARESAEINYEERQYENGQEPQILDIVSIPMVGPVPKIHQQENHMIDASLCWSEEGKVEWPDLSQLVDRPMTLWSNGQSTYAGVNDRVPQAETPQFRNSLWLIKPTNVSLSVSAPGAAFGNPKRAVRAGFVYRGTHYSLKVTDLSVERTYLAKFNGDYPLDRDCYLCVSLAEAHTDGYCYKLVATIITEQPL